MYSLTPPILWGDNVDLREVGNVDFARCCSDRICGKLRASDLHDCRKSVW